MTKMSHIIAVFVLIVLAMFLAACQPGAATEVQQVPQTAPTLAPTVAPSATAPVNAAVPEQSNENANANENDNANANDNANENSNENANENSEDYGDEDYGAPSSNTPDATAVPDPSAPGTVALDEVKLRFENTGSLGQILVDESGMTLYRFTNDAPNVSNCSGQCATNWPPVLVAPGGEVEIDGMDEEGLIGTITRADGSVQVTYKGQPLYYWINDMQPGDTTGQEVGGVWFVVNP